jgi:hypothetical protein
MNRKEALEAIEKNLEQGKSKAEVYQELLSKVQFKSDLTQYIAIVPSYEDRVKYNAVNMLLFYLLVFISATKLLFASLVLGSISLFALPLALLVPLISIYFAVSVKRFRGNMYRLIGMLVVAGILQGLSNIEQFSEYTFQQMMFELVFWLPAALIIFLSFFIGVKVFPYYGFWGNLKEDQLKETLFQDNRANHKGLNNDTKDRAHQ